MTKQEQQELGRQIREASAKKLAASLLRVCANYNQEKEAAAFKFGEAIRSVEERHQGLENLARKADKGKLSEEGMIAVKQALEIK
jgi:hypothetical protein